VIHHYSGKGQGLIWNLSSPQPRKLTELDMLPKETVISTFCAFYPGVLWLWVIKEAEASDMEKIKKGILAVEPMMQAQGIDLGKLLDSITGMGIVVTLDNENIKKVPLGKIALDIPDPAAAMVFMVKDDSIFKLLQSKIPIPQKEGETGEQKIQIPVPPMPVTMAPLILQRDGMLVIASNNWIVEKMWAARESGKGLVDTEEFEKMSAHISREGNGFRFTSARLLQTLLDAQEKIVAAQGKEDSEDARIFEFVKKVLPKELAVYGTVQNTGEGMTWTLNHTMNFSHLVLLPATAALGAAAAIAIPNIITATQKGKQKATMGDMKSVGLAVESYIVDHNQAPEAASMEELRAKLEPFYIKTIPLKDGWGNEFLYQFGSGDKKDTYGIASGGQDGVFNGWDQAGVYIVTHHEGFNNDIIFASGQFVYGPKVK
jgi:type II secretory pathway pseudopilin PulG